MGAESRLGEDSTSWLLGAQHAAPLQVGGDGSTDGHDMSCPYRDSEPQIAQGQLTGAELRGQIFLEGGDDFGGEIGGLGIRQSGFAALESDADEEGIFSGGDIFAAEEVGGFDGRDFGDVERADGFDDVGKRSAVGEEQGEIAFDGGETRKGLVTTRLFCGAYGGIQRVEMNFGEEDILAEFEFFGDAAGELAGDAEGC